MIGKIESGLSAARSQSGGRFGPVRTVPLDQQSHRRQGVEQDGKRATIRADPFGDLFRGERSGRRKGEQIELGTSQKDAAFHEAPAQSGNRLLAPLRLIVIRCGHGIAPFRWLHGGASPPAYAQEHLFLIGTRLFIILRHGGCQRFTRNRNDRVDRRRTLHYHLPREDLQRRAQRSPETCQCDWTVRRTREVSGKPDRPIAGVNRWRTAKRSTDE